MVPRIPLFAEPCTLQKYRYVPGLLNVCEYAFGDGTGAPLGVNTGLPAGVTSWKPPTQLQVTVVPSETVRLAGSNRLLPPSLRS